MSNPVERLARSLLMCLLGLSVAHRCLAQAPGEVAICGTLPDALLQGLNGPSRPLKAFRGKPLIINVWASWCGPCRQEMASLERLAWGSPTHDFSIIGISTDDYADQASRMLKGTNATISQFIDTGLQMERLLGATRLPLTVLIGADGRVLKRIAGAREWDDADSLRLIEATFRRSTRNRGACGE